MAKEDKARALVARKRAKSFKRRVVVQRRKDLARRLRRSKALEAKAKAAHVAKLDALPKTFGAKECGQPGAKGL
jgi:hypothetical protein